MDVESQANHVAQELTNKVALMLNPQGRRWFDKIRSRVQVAFAERLREELNAAIAQDRKDRA